MADPAPKPSYTNLDLINACDAFPYEPTSTSAYYALHVPDHPYPLGYLLPSVAETFSTYPDWTLSTPHRTLTLTASADPSSRSAAIASTLAALREASHFRVLDKWRNELYAVYGRNRELLFEVERAASPLLGVVSYGVHLTAYTRDAETGEVRIWIPRRAQTKQTYGGMLDNAVAGGIASGESAFESLVRECGEEASLDEALVRERARAVGAVTYFYVRGAEAGGETGLLQPEVQYVYDLELPQDVVPVPGDDEVEEFYLWGVEEVRAAMGRGEFKPNCAVVMLDWMVRHGVLTQENERDYLEIVARLHRRLEFPTL